MVRCDRTLRKVALTGGLLVGTLGLVGCGSAMNIAAVENEIKADQSQSSHEQTARQGYLS